LPLRDAESAVQGSGTYGHMGDKKNIAINDSTRSFQKLVWMWKLGWKPPADISRTLPAILQPMGVRAWSALSGKQSTKHRLRKKGWEDYRKNMLGICVHGKKRYVPGCGEESRNGQYSKPRMQQHMQRSPRTLISFSVNLNISSWMFCRAVDIWWKFLAFISLSSMEMRSTS
jgi:hypothetical protein